MTTGPNPRSVWLLAYAWAAYLLTRMFADFSSWTAYPTMSLQAMLNGTAVRPFVGRALVPIVIRWLDAHTGEFFHYQVMLAASSKGFATEFYVHGYTFEKAMLLALTWGFYLGFALLMRELVRRVYTVSETAAWAAGAAALMMVPALFTYYSHIYDPPTLFFSAALLLACEAANAWAFGALFLVASVNRETSVLYLPVWVGYAWLRGENHTQKNVEDVQVNNPTLRPKTAEGWGTRLTRLAWAAVYAALLGAAWVGIRYAINLRYQHNRGGVLDFHLLDHNVRVFSVAPLAAAWSLFIVLVVAVFCAQGWRSKPRQLRWSLALVGVPLLAGSLLYGYVEELRVYFEIYPLLFLLALPSVCQGLGVKATNFCGAAHQAQAVQPSI